MTREQLIKAIWGNDEKWSCPDAGRCEKIENSSPSDCEHIRQIKKEAYENGRLDERKEWEHSIATLMIKYAENIHEALPEQVKQIRTDTIDECIKAINENAFGKRKGLLHTNDIKIILEQLKEQK